jgi:Domain of unknown function (DUF4157)
MRQKNERDEPERDAVKKAASAEASGTKLRRPRSSMLGLQRKVGNRAYGEILHGRGFGEKRNVPQIVDEVLDTPGQPLDRKTREAMERGFVRDFSKVRVQANSEAADAANALDAQAFTVGDRIVFASGRYAPDSPAGKKLLAHELAHVSQQESSSQAGDRAVSAPGDEFETAADSAAKTVTAGGRASTKTGGRPPLIQRAPNTPPGSGAKDAPMLTRKEAEELLLSFLERARAAQSKKNVSIPLRTRNKIARLFIDSVAPPFVNDLTQGRVPSADSTFVAKTLANLLPEQITAAELDFLKDEIVPEESSKVGQISDLAGKTKPGESDTPLPESRQQGSEQTTGQKGPYGFDLQRAIRMAQGAAAILSPSAHARPLECPVPREIQGELDWVDFDEDLQLLPPAEKLRLYQAASAYETSPLREGNKADAKMKKQKEAERTKAEEHAAQLYDNSGETAYRLAGLFDCAHQKKATSVDLVLKASYNRLRPEDRPDIFKALAAIVGHVKRLLPDAAATVEDVRVFFGTNLVWVIKLATVPAGPPRPVEPAAGQQKN